MRLEDLREVLKEVLKEELRPLVESLKVIEEKMGDTQTEKKSITKRLLGK